MKTRVITELDKIFFTADLHLNHANILEYCNRPFKDVAEMNRTIISNWNNKITDSDFVYILGDFCWGDRKMWCYFLHQLPGHKILIQGNHDKDNNIPSDLFDEIIWGFLNMEFKKSEIKGSSQRLTLCHYPMLSWYQSHRGAWQLFGHWHSGKVVPHSSEEVEDYVREEMSLYNRIRPSQYDVGVDGNDFAPVSYYEIGEIITKNLKINLENQK